MKGADALFSIPGSPKTHPVWKQMALYKSDDSLHSEMASSEQYYSLIFGERHRLNKSSFNQRSHLHA